MQKSNLKYSFDTPSSCIHSGVFREEECLLDHSQNDDASNPVLNAQNLRVVLDAEVQPRDRENRVEHAHQHVETGNNENERIKGRKNHTEAEDSRLQTDSRPEVIEIKFILTKNFFC